MRDERGEKGVRIKVKYGKKKYYYCRNDKYKRIMFSIEVLTILN